MGIPRRIQVFVSEIAETAETSGFFKPLILLPVSLLTRLTPQQVEAILVHELFISAAMITSSIYVCPVSAVFSYSILLRIFLQSHGLERNCL
jgi:beta-lactamase regulating signal transducer with metallopeptidase domain